MDACILSALQMRHMFHTGETIFFTCDLVCMIVFHEDVLQLNMAVKGVCGPAQAPLTHCIAQWHVALGDYKQAASMLCSCLWCSY